MTATSCFKKIGDTEDSWPPTRQMQCTLGKAGASGLLAVSLTAGPTRLGAKRLFARPWAKADRLQMPDREIEALLLAGFRLWSPDRFGVW
jgi:hypothetical protein